MTHQDSMHPARRTLLWLNLLGGAAVLGSYAHGIATHPATSGLVWGDVPAELRPLYTLNMFLAAAGYLTFTFLIFFRTTPDTSAASGVPYRVWNLLYAAVLLPSALWMPLTFAMIDAPGAGLWLAIRVTLGVVGLASVGLIVCLWKLRRASPQPLHGIALAGASFFALQTAVLDALVWPAFYPA